MRSTGIEDRESRLLASRAGRRRTPAAAGPAAGTIGRPAHAEPREALFRLLRSALRAVGRRIRAEDQLLKAFRAGTTLIFVDRHDMNLTPDRSTVCFTPRCPVRYFFSSFFQSARNFSIPMSVSGCFASWSMTLNGMVAMCAPAMAASSTWSGFRTLATITSVA